MLRQYRTRNSPRVKSEQTGKNIHSFKTTLEKHKLHEEIVLYYLPNMEMKILVGSFFKFAQFFLRKFLL